MSVWKVSAERIKLFPHPKADRLRVGRVGMYQVVVNEQGGYRDGDVVVFAPRRAILPEDLRPHYVNPKTGLSYLVGENFDRVSHARMRGVLSEGIIVPPEYVKAKLGVASLDDLTVGEDLAGALGISKHVVPIPPDLVGKVADLNIDLPFRTHDVQYHHTFGANFKDGEPVLFSEKVHGIQGVFTLMPDGTRYVTSKGLADERLTMLEDYEGNAFWQAARNTDLFAKLAAAFPGRYVQAFGEVLPTQRGGFTYGFDGAHKTALLFRLVVDAQEIAPVDVIDRVRHEYAALADMWVPELYRGPYDLAKLKELAQGMETVSGRSLHIREGGVVSPVVPRMSEEGYPLLTKLVSPDFAESDDDPS